MPLAPSITILEFSSANKRHTLETTQREEVMEEYLLPCICGHPPAVCVDSHCCAPRARTRTSWFRPRRS